MNKRKLKELRKQANYDIRSPRQYYFMPNGVEYEEKIVNEHGKVVDTRTKEKHTLVCERKRGHYRLLKKELKRGKT